MSYAHNKYVSQVVCQFALEGLNYPVDLEFLAKKWGVTNIEKRPIDSDAMLVSKDGTHTVVIKDVKQRAQLARQRFSFAHELGHLLLHTIQFPSSSGIGSKHRGQDNSNDLEEKLCDQIASEILMPRLAFQEDGWLEGWSIRTLTTLAQKYGTSIPATAIRMIDLMPDPSLLGVWKVSPNVDVSPKLQWWHAQSPRYGLINASVLASGRLGLVQAAWNHNSPEFGVAPLVDKHGASTAPYDVPAEALAWGKNEYRQVMVYYYPERDIARVKQ